MPDPGLRITIEEAELLYRNFVGREDRYNQPGDRNFCVYLDDGIADQLKKDGWNVRIQEPREEGDAPRFYLPVAVSFKYYPPQITLITSTGRKRIDEDTIASFDGMTFTNVDIVCNGSRWGDAEKGGIKAYLKTMFATLEEDELERKYAMMELEEGDRR